MASEALVTGLIALQFVAFGWRIAREIHMGDQDEPTRLIDSDWLNLGSLVAMVVFCVVRPLQTGDFGQAAHVVLAVGYVLIAAHPLNTAAHYGILVGGGRSKPYPRRTGQEKMTTVCSGLVAVFVGILMWCSN